MKLYTSAIAPTLIAAIMCIAADSSAQSVQQSYASTHITNTTGKPLSLLNITNDKGEKIAELFITGKDAYFGADQRVVKGSGYIQAQPNETVTILVLLKRSQPKEGGPNYRQLAIRVNRIDWDDEGKTTAVSGIAPTIQTSLNETWKIVSPLDKPTLKDGVLTLELEKQGKASFDIRFGDKGTLVGDADFLFDDSKK